MKPARPDRHRCPHHIAAAQRGVGVIVALLVLVVLASLAAAMVRLNWGQQMSSAQDVQGAQALQAAGAGVEVGLYKALRVGGGWDACSGATTTLDMRATTGMWVTVTCNSKAFVEGLNADGTTPRAVRVYRIDAVACNGAATCPDNTRAATATYIERQRQVTATSIATDE